MRVCRDAESALFSIKAAARRGRRHRGGDTGTELCRLIGLVRFKWCEELSSRGAGSCECTRRVQELQGFSGSPAGRQAWRVSRKGPGVEGGRTWGRMETGSALRF